MYLAYKAIKKNKAKKREAAAAAAAAAAEPSAAAYNTQPVVSPSTDSNGAAAEKEAVPTAPAATASVAASPVADPKKLCTHQRRAIRDAAALEKNPDQLAASTTPPGDLLNAKGKCIECKREKHNSRVYRWKLIAGLLMPFLLSSIDLTVVATALGFIATYFGKYDQLNWIVTSYTLTSTAFIPIFGQLADIFGRHTMLQTAIVIMVVGSTLAAAAQTWGMLLFGRALQGMSAAGIQVLISIVLADKVSLRENAKNNSIFSFVSGVSYSIGPIVGGYLTNSNWRYCFVLSIPIAVLANLIIFFILRKELLPGTFGAGGHRTTKTFFQSLRSIDVGGTILFLFGVGLIILATAWGGATYAWNSVHVLVPLIIGCVLFIFFLPYEFLLEDGKPLSRRFPHQIPMIPYHLFAKRDVLRLGFIQFGTGASLYSIFYFVGIYFTLVEGYSASKAGVQLLYYIPGIGVGVYGAMFLCNVWPCQTFWPLVSGTLIEFIGFCLLTWAITTRNIPIVNGMMGLAGVGTGLRFMPSSLHMVGIWPEKIASAQSIMRFMLPFGGTLALTIMGSVFNNELASRLVGTGVTGLQSSGLHSQHGLGLLRGLSAQQRAATQDAGKHAVFWAFVSILPILGLSVIVSFFLGNVWIKTAKIGHKAEAAAGDGQLEEDQEGYSESKALYSMYLLALFRGRVQQEQVASRMKGH